MEQLISATVRLGDPAPWFSAPTITGGSVDMHVSGGRWVVISFLGNLAEPRAEAERQVADRLYGEHDRGSLWSLMRC